MQARTDFVELSLPEDELLADEKMIESLLLRIVNLMIGLKNVILNTLN